MTLQPGQNLRQYRVIDRIGAGGMGEVYRAEDTRLGRQVALKVLPAALRGDEERLARLEREARLLAKLNHPHIATLHGLEESEDDTRFLVMELVEGETLAARLARGRASLSEACTWGAQIAEGLAAAHARGIVHRDLKPANIMLTSSGLKLLDFGLARTTAFGIGDAQTQASTVAVEPDLVTKDGAVLGTVGYMAPEVLEGGQADARSDLWAFGSVLHEMLTGRPPFEGSSPASRVAATMGQEPPPVSRDCEMSPPWLDHLVATCLAKDPKQRRRDANDLALDLRQIGSTVAGPAGEAVGDGAHPAGSTRRALPWITTAMMAIVAVLAWVLRPGNALGPGEERGVSFNLDVAYLAGNATETAMAVSPDGDAIVYVDESAPGRVPVLWLRELAVLGPHRIAGSESALNPFWSPDGVSIGFVQGNVIRVVDRQGGPIRTVASVGPSGTFGPPSWGADGTILFSSRTVGQESADGFRLQSVPAEGGDPTLLNAAGPGEVVFPHFLPDGDGFLCLSFRQEGSQAGELHVGSLGGGEPIRVEGVHTRAEYGGGHLFYLEQGQLLARPFDPSSAAFGGPATSLGHLTGAYIVNTGMAHFSVARTDGSALAFGSATRVDELCWFDLDGKDIGRLGEPAVYDWFRLSPSGDRLAIAVEDPDGSSDISILDVQRGVPTPLLRGPADDTCPVWSPDGRQIAYSSDAMGIPSIFLHRPDGGGRPSPLRTEHDDLPQYTMDWSPNGEFIAYTTWADDMDLFVQSIHEERSSRLLAGGPGHQYGGRFSPDSRWVAFVAEEGERLEIFLVSLVGDGAPRRVTAEGGRGPVWSPDGKELYYHDSNSIYGVEFDQDSGTLGTTRDVVSVPVPGKISSYSGLEITPDGSRFLVAVTDGRRSGSHLTVQLNPLSRKGTTGLQ